MAGEGGNVLRSLVVRLIGDTSGFNEAMKQAASDAQKHGGLISNALNGAMGAIGDVAKVAAGAAVAGVGALTTAAIGGITAYNDWAQQLDSLGDVLGTSANDSAALAVAIQGVGGDVDAITAQMAKLSKGLVDGSGKIGETGKTLQEMGVAFQDSNGRMLDTTTILEGVANKLAAMPDGLEKTRLMTELFGKSGKDLSDTMNALANGGLQAAKKKSEELGLAIGETGVNQSIAFGKGMETLKQSLQGVMVSIGNQLMPVLVPMIQKFADFAVQVMPQVREAVRVVFEWLRDNILPLIQAIGKFISDHGEEIKRIISTAWNTIKTVIETVLGVIGGIIRAVMDILKGDWSGAWNEVKGVLERIWNGIKDVVQTAWNAVAGFIGNGIQSIINFLLSLPGRFFDIGRQIIEGLWNGIKQMFQNVINGVGDFFNNLVAQIKRVLGIQSPSQVFHGLGQNLMLGLGAGITSMADVPQAAIQRALNGMTANVTAIGGGGNVSSTTNYYLTAQYQHQTERTLRDEVRMLNLLG